MILGGIGKRIARTDHVGIANDDEIPKIQHSLFSTPMTPPSYLTRDKVDSRLHMSAVRSAGYI